MRLRANTKKRKAAHRWATDKPTREAAADVVARLERTPLHFGEVRIKVEDLASSNLTAIGVELAARAQQAHIIHHTDQTQFEAVYGPPGASLRVRTP